MRRQILEHGAYLEIDALNGAAVSLSRTLGVPTPASQAIYATLQLAQLAASSEKANLRALIVRYNTSTA